jgi:hypothetical protein
VPHPQACQLGFEVESEHAFGLHWPLYVRMRRGPAQLHLSEHRLDGGPVTHVYLYVEDVDSVIPAGWAAEDCPWGMREARLTDPDPYNAQAERCVGMASRSGCLPVVRPQHAARPVGGGA